MNAKMRLEVAGLLEVAQTADEGTEQGALRSALPLQPLSAFVQIDALVLEVVDHFTP